MKLLIAIPALNEEESIEEIILRTWEARQYIVDHSPVAEVEITVVSDGSADRTVEIAKRHTDKVNLIVFDRNRGYGAAIKAAWAGSKAEVLGFLDADGTCDPKFFADLCRTLVQDQADVVVGGRLNADSRMPFTRKLGNIIFATMLSVFSSMRVRDAASGMRVVRRSCLPRLMSLPEGLSFTPAMSARAILSDDLRIVEIPMSYHERAGVSKLHVLKDGVRFLRVILDAVFLYRPSRPLGIIGLLLMATSAGLMVTPVLYYLSQRAVLEWMIYRFLMSNFFAVSGVLLLCASYLCGRIVMLTLTGRGISDVQTRLGTVFFGGPLWWIVASIFVVAGTLLVLPSLMDLLQTGHTQEHWSRFVAMSFFFQVALILVITRLVDYVLDLIAIRLEDLKTQSFH